MLSNLEDRSGSGSLAEMVPLAISRCVDGAAGLSRGRSRTRIRDRAAWGRSYGTIRSRRWISGESTVGIWVVSVIARVSVIVVGISVIVGISVSVTGPIPGRVAEAEAKAVAAPISTPITVTSVPDVASTATAAVSTSIAPSVTAA